jgi:hypothetical protein
MHRSLRTDAASYLARRVVPRYKQTLGDATYGTIVSPFDIFNPSTMLDPSAFTGPAGANALVEAARHFPGGPTMLVFALFWAPVGPGIPAGVLLARHIPLNPAFTFLLYTTSDVLGAAVCHPIFRLLRRAARRVPAIKWLGERMIRFAMLGTRVPRAQDLQGAGMAPALFRIATVGFGVDVYSAGMLVNALHVPRILGWASAIAGDLVWFALLLGTSLATAAIVDDDRIIGGVVLVAMLVIPSIARRIFPALRDAPSEPAPAATPTAPARRARRREVADSR